MCGVGGGRSASATRAPATLEAPAPTAGLRQQSEQIVGLRQQYARPSSAVARPPLAPLADDDDDDDLDILQL